MDEWARHMNERMYAYQSVGEVIYIYIIFRLFKKNVSITDN